MIYYWVKKKKKEEQHIESFEIHLSSSEENFSL